MVYGCLRRFLFIVGSLMIIIPSVILSAESDFPLSDEHIENDSQQTRFRDKRTLDFILHGLAQMLGYRLQRNSAQTATASSPPPPPPPTPPPTQPAKLITQTTPSQIVFLSLADVDLKRKQAAAESPRLSAVTDNSKHYPYGRYRTGPDYVRNGHNDKSSQYYKPDYGHVGYDGPDYVRVGNDGKNSQYIRIGYNRDRGDLDHGKDGRSSDSSNNYRNHHRNDKVDEYLERIGHYIKDQFRGRKKDKDENNTGHSIKESNQFKSNGASKAEDGGNEGEWNKDRKTSEYSMNGSRGDQGNSEVSEGQQSGGHESDTTKIEQKGVTNKSGGDHNDKASNEEHLKSPENIKQKEISVQKSQQDNGKEEPVEEKEHIQKSKQEISETGSVEQEHMHNSKEGSGEKQSIDHSEGEHPGEDKDRKEDKYKEGAYYNQIPAPSLQTWDEDFWNSRYSFADNSPYSHGLFDAPRSHKDEQKDLHTIPEFSFNRPSADKGSSDFKPAQPEPYFHRPQYFNNPGFESVHDWHVTSARQSEKPSFGPGVHKESSEPQGEFKEEQETSDGVRDSPIDPSVNSDIEIPEPSKPSTHRLAVTDSPPMPIHSTTKPKLVQLIHEIEGTKQNPLWPPPFDHAFESTDSSIVTHQPARSDVMLSKKVPGHISPLQLNLYNYSSVSDYLLHLSSRGSLPKQAYRFSQQHTKSGHASENQKSPVSYVAVVIPNQSKENTDNSVPPEPSFVGVVYPHRFLDGDTKEALGFTSGRSDKIKNNKIPISKPLAKTKISNPTQKAPHNNRDEIQDPPFETHYKPLYRGGSSALLSIASTNISGGHIHNYPDSYVTPLFHNPTPHSNTNSQQYSVTSASDYRKSNDASQHAKHSVKNSYHYPDNIYDNPFFYNPEAGSLNKVPSQETLLGTIRPSNSSLHGHSENLHHDVPFYWRPFEASEGSYKFSAQTQGASAALDSRTPSNYEHEHVYGFPDTYHSSVFQNTGRNAKTNASKEGLSSALNFRHPSNSSESIYNHNKNGIARDYPDVDYRIFQNTETRPPGSTVSDRSYNNYQNHEGNIAYRPSTFSSDGGAKSLSIKKPLRLVIPDLQPHTTPDSQSKFRVVIPDFPQSEYSVDYLSGSEQNEFKNAAFQDNVGLFTIPPPTPYSDDPGTLKNLEKWVQDDDTPNSKNLKTKEYIRRVSKVHVTGKVQKQPKTV